MYNFAFSVPKVYKPVAFISRSSEYQVSLKFKFKDMKPKLRDFFFVKPFFFCTEIKLGGVIHFSEVKIAKYAKLHGSCNI